MKQTKNVKQSTWTISKQTSKQMDHIEQEYSHSDKLSISFIYSALCCDVDLECEIDSKKNVKCLI